MGLAGADGDQAPALRALLHQTMRAGVPRRAIVLHTDRLPASFARAHHRRLARDALTGLALADRAQAFTLSRGRMAVVWRQKTGLELESVMAALHRLVADLPDEQAVNPGSLITLYDLPEQGEWLLDALDEPEAPHGAAAAATRPLDAALLASLERALSQADITPFIRRRAVIASDTEAPLWQERGISIRALQAALCPLHDVKAEPWLFRRLTRSFDRRMLSLLTGPRELREAGPFGLSLNVATILAPEFLRFDTELPGKLRGNVHIALQAGDVLADTASFVFARNFLRAREYRLVLADASPALLGLLDVAVAEFDYVRLPFTAEVQAAGAALALMVPEPAQIIIAEGHAMAGRLWARAQGFPLVRTR